MKSRILTDISLHNWVRSESSIGDLPAPKWTCSKCGDWTVSFNQPFNGSRMNQGMTCFEIIMSKVYETNVNDR